MRTGHPANSANAADWVLLPLPASPKGLSALNGACEMLTECNRTKKTPTQVAAIEGGATYVAVTALRMATPEQQEEWLPQVTSGE